MEAPPRFELGIKVLQTSALPLGYGAIWSGRRDSNPRPSPWQGDTLPLSHFRTFWCPEAESNHRHGDFQSPALPTELSGLNITFIVYAKLKFLSNFFKISQRNNSIYIFKFTKSFLFANKIFQKKSLAKQIIFHKFAKALVIRSRNFLSLIYIP